MIKRKVTDARGNAPATESAADDSGLVTKRAVARDNCVSVRTVEHWIKEKRIPVVRLSPRCVRLHLGRVRAALRRFEVKEVTQRS